MPPQPKFVIFAHHATYDTLHQVATFGLTAAAMGKDVIVILLFWTIKKLAEGKIDQGLYGLKNVLHYRREARRFWRRAIIPFILALGPSKTTIGNRKCAKNTKS